MANWSGRPSANGDDGRTTAGAWSSANNPAVGLSATSVAFNMAFRFPNVTIPQGATITAATITLGYSYVDTGNIDTDIYAIDENDHNAPASTGEWDADHANHTTASVAFDWAAAAADVTTPDIKAVIQEIVDRVGWASGQAIGIHIDNSTVVAGAVYQCTAYENSNTGALLEITYTTTQAESGSGSTTAATGATASGEKAASGDGDATTAAAATGSGVKAAAGTAAAAAVTAIDATGEAAKAGTGAATAATGTAATGAPARETDATATAATGTAASGTKDTTGVGAVTASTGTAATGAGGLADDATLTAATATTATGTKNTGCTATLTATPLIWASGTRQIYMEVRPPIDHFETGRLPKPPDFPPLQTDSPRLPEPVEKHLTVTTDDGPRQFVVPDTR